MTTNERTLASTPKTVWEWLDRDESSPLHRLYRLQSALCALSLALANPGRNDHANPDHLCSFAEAAFAESGNIISELENWLAENPYFSTLKTS